MERSDIPFNIRLLVLTDKKLEGLRPVTSTDIYDGQTRNFHENGLFSVLTFGRVGDEKRAMRFSFINIRVAIFHPVVYRALCDLKRLYAGILDGTQYAIWDSTVNDFVKSTAQEGETGFDFFVKYWEKINFDDDRSGRPGTRDFNIRLIRKYYQQALTSKIVVMPAGLRDIQLIDGREEMDDVNSFYHSLLSISNRISDAAIRNNPETLNLVRSRLQTTFNNLYDYIENMVKGKEKLFLSSWAARATFDGTRNVITAMDTSMNHLDDPGNLDINDTLVGLYQAAKAARPISIYNLKNGFLSKVFSTVDAPVKLINKKTLRTEYVDLPPKYFDRFMTDEGLEKVLTSYGVEALRSKEMEIAGYWLGLIYKGPDGTFKLFQDIEELPAGFDKKYVSPMNFTELLYISVYRAITGLPIFCTRYPITGVGSIYPAKLYLQPTLKYEQRLPLNDNWEKMDASQIAFRFPVRGSGYFNSMSPHSTRLAGLGAD